MFTRSDVEAILRADIKLSDICSSLSENEWKSLAKELGIVESDVDLVEKEYPNDTYQQTMIILRLWLQMSGNSYATGVYRFLHIML